jgi:solute carrier family 40 (iron-regulated transporter), member 1
MTHFESLFLVSTYGLISWGCLLLFGSAMARFFVDTISWNRQSALIMLIVAENVAVIAGCLVSYEIFQRDDEYFTHQQQQQQQPQHAHSWMRTVLLTILFTSGSIGLVLQQTMVVVLERDWLIVVAAHQQQQATTTGGVGDDPDSLGEMNVVVRQIDLACRVLTPAFAGSLIGWLQHGATDNIRDLRQAALVLGMLNAISMVVEIVFMTRLYHLVPGLATRHHLAEKVAAVNDGKPAGDHKSGPKTSTTAIVTTPEETTTMCYGVRIYFQQPVAAAGVALSFLYLNALTFGGIMTAYLLSRGMSMSSVGLWRGLSAISGLCGTFVYRHLRQQRCCSLVMVGFVSILFQCVVLSIGVVSMYLPTTLLSYSTAVSLLVGTVIVSRIGLYGFDIAVTQLMQEQIPAPIRGVIGGTQQSLNAACQIASFILSMAFQDPKDFPTYATIGYFGTVVAAALFGGRMLLFQPPASHSEHYLLEEAT